VIDELARQDGLELELIDPATLDLPFPGKGRGAIGPKRLRKAVGEATGVVLATPEYHGS
jgi:NAD(P)H-dependent FMN reductase